MALLPLAGAAVHLTLGALRGPLSPGRFGRALGALACGAVCAAAAIGGAHG